MMLTPGGDKEGVVRKAHQERVILLLVPAHRLQYAIRVTMSWHTEGEQR